MTDFLLSLFVPGLIILACAGWGSLGPAPFKSINPPSVYELAAWGLCYVGLLALLGNLFFPLGENVGIATLLVGLAAIFWKALSDRKLRRNLWTPIVMCIAYTILAGRIAPSYDAGLYHIPYMNWIAKEPVVLGLANLEGRFGFNSLWLMIVSAFRFDFALSWSHLVYAEIAVRSLVLGWVLSRLTNAVKNGPSALVILHSVSFWVILIFLLIMGRSTSTDHAANLFAFLAWLRFSEMLLVKPTQTAETKSALLWILILVLLATLFKLSMIPFALLPIQAFLMAGVRFKDLRPIPISTLLVLGALVIGWMLRNVAISGCLVFPAAHSCFDLPWTVPRPDLESVSGAVTGWAVAWN